MAMEKRSLLCTANSDDDWYNLVRIDYEAKAADLAAQGFERRPVADIRHEIFVKDGQALQIVRRLAEHRHFTVDTEFPKEDGNGHTR